jgi:hypothetical protein
MATQNDNLETDVLTIIEVIPGWYIEKILDDNWEYNYNSNIANGDVMIRSIALTSDPLLAQDFTRTMFPQREKGILASFANAKVVKYSLNPVMTDK